MIEKGRISTRQIAVLMFLFLLGDCIIIYPTVLTNVASQDAWIASLLGVLFGVMLVWVLLRLHRKYPEQNLIQITQTVLGKWIGGLLSIWYLFFFFFSTALYLRQMGDFLTTQYFLITPLRIIIILLISILICGAASGMESIARSAEIMLPLLLLASAFLVISLLPQSDLSQLKPVLVNKPLSILHAVIIVITYPYGQSIVFSMLFPQVNKQPHMQRDVLIAAAASGIILTIILLTSLLVLGPFLCESTTYTTFFLAKKISIGNFLQRLEAIITIAWIITTFFKTVLTFYVSLLSTAQFFKLKDFRSLIWVAALVIFGLSIIVSPNSEYYRSEFVPYWTLWDFTNGLILPLLLLVLPAWSLRRQKKSKQSQEE